MNPQKTITICGREVDMLYCAGAETGYEEISEGKSSDVFSPHRDKDENGNEIFLPPEATTGDWIKLAFASIICAYAKIDKKTPISIKDILYDATPLEVTELITAVFTLRNEWYKIPSVVKEEMKPAANADNQKNA